MAKGRDEKPERLPAGEASGDPSPKDGVGTGASAALSPVEIKGRRKGARLTQMELGNALGVSLRTVVRWEKGESDPGPAEVAAIKSLPNRSSTTLAAMTAGGLLGAALVPGVGSLAAFGIGAGLARGLFGNRSSEPEPSPSFPSALRDVLLASCEALDVSPRKLRQALAAMVSTALEENWDLLALQRGLVDDVELPEGLRMTLLTAADELDISPRKLRAACSDVLRVALASQLDDRGLRALLLGSSAGDRR